jgi:hypothetical protein
LVAGEGLCRPEPAVTVPRSVADLLDDHVVWELECPDRLYLNLYQPRLQHALGVVGFFKYHRGFPIASSALMDPITKTFVAGIRRFVADHGVDLVGGGRVRGARQRVLGV